MSFFVSRSGALDQGALAERRGKLGRVSRSSLRSFPTAVEEWVKGYDVVRRAMSGVGRLWWRPALTPGPPRRCFPRR